MGWNYIDKHKCFPTKLLEMIAKEANISSEIFNKLVEKNRESLDALLETMLIMLKEIEKQYPKNLKIFEKED